MDYKEEQMILAFKWRAKMTGNIINKLMEKIKIKKRKRYLKS